MAKNMSAEDIQKEIDKRETEIQKLRDQKAKIEPLENETKTVLALATYLHNLALPDPLEDSDGLRDALVGAKDKIKEAYELLFPQQAVTAKTGKRGRPARGQGSVKEVKEGKGSPRPLSPVKTALEAHPEGLTDTEIGEVSTVKAWLTNKAQWTPEQLIAWLNENIGKTAKDGGTLTLENGRYYMK